MLKKGYYRTKGGRYVTFDWDVPDHHVQGTIGSVIGIGLVAYRSDGVFELKDEHPSFGDELDVLLDTWQEQRPLW